VIGEDGLVMPRKLRNPCLDSPANRDLNRQIKWNAKAGVNVLTKSELERVLDRQRRLQVEREKGDEREEEESPFDKVLKQRAKRLEQLESGGCTDQSRDSSPEPENQPVATKTNLFEPPAVRPARNQSPAGRPARHQSPAGRPTRHEHLKAGDCQQPWRSNSPNKHCLQKSPPVDSRSKSPAAVGHGVPGFSSSPSFNRCSNNNNNNNNNKLDKDLETRLRAIKQHQNEENLKPRQTGRSSGNSSSGPRHLQTGSSCGNSSSNASSKSSSPEPELLKVFAQLRTHKDDFP